MEWNGGRCPPYERMLISSRFPPPQAFLGVAVAEKGEQVGQLAEREVADDSGGHQTGLVGAFLLDLPGRNADLAPLGVLERDGLGRVGEQETGHDPAVARGDLERAEPLLDLLRGLQDRLDPLVERKGLMNAG